MRRKGQYVDANIDIILTCQILKRLLRDSLCFTERCYRFENPQTLHSNPRWSYLLLGVSSPRTCQHHRVDSSPGDSNQRTGPAFRHFRGV
ncbi:hypothetical protein RRG08_018982 [Elysia crispata]|uniref:Uncharacterized protein n=1 Tax=Elysia crispata TaxID=231223 RepID=A0AAE1A644_9GAST|nr:hypothetical protein RRG08_018982 [Elysia crispata]